MTLIQTQISTLPPIREPTSVQPVSRLIRSVRSLAKFRSNLLTYPVYWFLGMRRDAAIADKKRIAARELSEKIAMYEEIFLYLIR